MLFNGLKALYEIETFLSISKKKVFFLLCSRGHCIFVIWSTDSHFWSNSVVKVLKIPENHKNKFHQHISLKFRLIPYVEAKKKSRCLISKSPKDMTLEILIKNKNLRFFFDSLFSPPDFLRHICASREAHMCPRPKMTLI